MLLCEWMHWDSSCGTLKNLTCIEILLLDSFYHVINIFKGSWSNTSLFDLTCLSRDFLAISLFFPSSLQGKQTVLL